jgi:DNA-binding transcriptional regulator LsrR (DeoR family)
MTPSALSSRDMRVLLCALELRHEGVDEANIARTLHIDPKYLRQLLLRAREVADIRFRCPYARQLEAKLIRKYKLLDAKVVVYEGEPDGRRMVGQAAAEFLSEHLGSGDGLAVSCGETLLETAKAFPDIRTLELTISQMSVEGAPEFIHQAPATIVGIFRSKVSSASTVEGIQFLMGCKSSTKASTQLGPEMRRLVSRLRQRVLSSRLICVGVGQPSMTEPPRGSFECIANRATNKRFRHFVQRLGIVGEINNAVFDREGRDRTKEIPGLKEHILNVVGLDDIRDLARDHSKFVVCVTAGANKVSATRIALEKRLVNCLITTSEVAALL